MMTSCVNEDCMLEVRFGYDLRPRLNVFLAQRSP